MKWWDPCRNAILLLVGLAHAESFYISTQERFDVYIGIRRETPVAMKDNTPEFLEEINRLGEQATHHGGYRMLAPLITYDKDKVVKLGAGARGPLGTTPTAATQATASGRSEGRSSRSTVEPVQIANEGSSPSQRAASRTPQSTRNPDCGRCRAAAGQFAAQC